MAAGLMVVVPVWQYVLVKAIYLLESHGRAADRAKRLPWVDVNSPTRSIQLVVWEITTRFGLEETLSSAVVWAQSLRTPAAIRRSWGRIGQHTSAG
jgi:hypothetical protein